MSIELVIAVLSAIFGGGGFTGGIVALRQIGIDRRKAVAEIERLKDKTDAKLQEAAANIERMKQDSVMVLIKELTSQRQNSEKEREDCEKEKEELRDRFDKKIEELRAEIELRGTRILMFKSMLIENKIPIPDGF